MKTAELQVEQVLVGALVLGAGLLPWLPELGRWVEAHGNALNLLAGTVVLGAAYLLGILFDRLADTLTERLEAHQRLRFGLYHRFTVDKVEWTDSGWPDLFPEDKYRMLALRDEEAVVGWIDYHRLRVRLSRALAVYLPVLTWCAIVGIGRYRRIEPPQVWLAWVGWFVIAAAWFVTIVQESLLPTRWLPTQWKTLHTAPRTDSQDAIAYARNCGFFGPADELKWRQMVTLFQAFGFSPAIIGTTVLLASSVVLAATLDLSRGAEPELLPIAILGTVLSVLAMRSWWRISRTYRTYLKQVGDSQQDRRR